MLEQAGLIGRHPVPTDRRAYALRATLKGRRLRDKAALALAAHEDAMLAGLSPQERAQLIDLLQRIGPTP